MRFFWLFDNIFKISTFCTYIYFINLWICIGHFLKRKHTLNINIEYFTFKYYWNIDLLVWRRLDSLIKISLYFVRHDNIQACKQVYEIFNSSHSFKLVLLNSMAKPFCRFILRIYLGILCQVENCKWIDEIVCNVLRTSKHQCCLTRKEVASREICDGTFFYLKVRRLKRTGLHVVWW